ncbi:alpha/beta fold hydrolase [Massilia litorea]|uniref:Alpha/beta hydrolase n=1 Tax=Massilia litorea TaxID=2769491 RepID=A0A7L9U4B6_9BURK|nr:alpha/beta hydrolase [Massilia litorea]QOL48876.1 alpha/beta hydrolase [Massilia litorea]
MKATLLFALLAASLTPAFAADVPAAPNRFAGAVAPAERFELQGMLVERFGAGGKPLVLIPGLATGGWVWQETVRAFAGSQAVYVVTLPGFDGRPAVEGNPFDAAKSALKELIASRRLASPVLVGHSLGATLAIALAEELPGRIGGTVAIDGLPVMPRTEDSPPEQRAAMADAMRQRMAAADPAAFAAQQRQYMRAIGTVDMGKADDLAQLTSRSDPAAVAAWVGAVLALDLRPGLSKITAPVLVLAPFYGPDSAAQGGISSADKVAYYRELMTGTPKLEVAPVENARHFAMIDQPQAVNDALRRFLKNL